MTKIRTAAVALAAATVSTATLLAAPAAAAPTSGNRCTAPLTYGSAVVTRTTGSIGGGRHWTSITLGTDGDGYRLVWNRGYGYGTKGSLTVRARGIVGEVHGTRSWGFVSRTGETLASVGGVDVNTGRYFEIDC